MFNDGRILMITFSPPYAHLNIWAPNPTSPMLIYIRFRLPPPSFVTAPRSLTAAATLLNVQWWKNSIPSSLPARICLVKYMSPHPHPLHLGLLIFVSTPPHPSPPEGILIFISDSALNSLPKAFLAFLPSPKTNVHYATAEAHETLAFSWFT